MVMWFPETYVFINCALLSRYFLQAGAQLGHLPNVKEILRGVNEGKYPTSGKLPPNSME